MCGIQQENTTDIMRHSCSGNNHGTGGNDNTQNRAMVAAEGKNNKSLET